MSFLAPLFLLGAIGIVGPILYHLIRRNTRERTRFSTLMFLLPSPPRISKRHRLEHLLLLLLRCLALALLALGFARPFFRQSQLTDPAAARPKRTLVLVDVSASMRRAGLWDAARARTEKILSEAGRTDQVALFTFDRQATPLVSFEEWNRTPAGDRASLATSRLAAVSPGWGGTHLGNALIAAAEALAENDSATRAPPADGPREIVLVSDVQAGSRLDALQAYEWPKKVGLRIESLKPRNPTNAGLQLVADANGSNRASDPGVRVRVTNSADAKREQFKVGWARPATAGAAAEYVGPPIDAYVPPGQSRVFLIPTPKNSQAPAGAAPTRIVLRGDDEEFDDTLYVIPPVQQHAGVLWLGRDAPDDSRQPLFFLRSAFFDTPRLAVKVEARAPDAPLAPELVKGANVIFVAEPLPENSARALREAVLAGKLVVVVPKTPAVAPTLGALLGRDVPMEEVHPASYAMLAEIDFQHPLFAPFSDPRFSDFTKIHVWRYRKMDFGGVSDARIVAKFDSGDPAVVDVPVGKGRVFVLATGWQTEDSQLAVSSKFVPLVWSWLEMGGGVNAAPAQFFVGDTLPAGAAAEAARQPGIVTLTPTQRMAVNLDASESRTTPLSLDELEQLGVPVAPVAAEAARAAENKTVLQGIEAENRQKLWRWLIAATLAVLLIETALAGWSARRANLPPEEATP